MSSWATTALFFGVAGFTCLPGIGGVLAVLLGVGGLVEVSRSNGTVRGRGRAIAGALLGAANLALLIAFAATAYADAATSPRPTFP